MSLLITPLLKKNLKDALRLYNYYVVNSFANFEEKKCLSSCSISLEIYSVIIRSKLFEFKNYLSEGPIYFAAGLIKMSCSLCSK